MKSNGLAGEKAAEIWFRRAGWQMFKVPPDVRVCGQTGRPGIFLAAFRDGGIADFLGCNRYGDFMACEVKEAGEDRMPASRLSKKQREFMAGLPDGRAFVGILWRDGTFELYNFLDRGSYKKGQGQ